MGWGVADQAASNLTNVVGLVLIARLSAPESFGAVSVAFGLLAVALTAGRGMWGEALLILRSGAEGDEERDLAATAHRGALYLGVALGSVVVLSAAFTSGALTGPLVVAGVGLPLLLAQDVGRYALFGRGRQHVAFVSDVAWLLTSIMLLGVGGGLGWSSSWLLAAWLGGAAVGLVVVLAAIQPWKGTSAVPRWLSEERRIWAPLTGDVLGGAGFRALALMIVIATVGLAEGGGFRAAQVLMGPVAVLTMATAPLFLSHMGELPASRTSRVVAGVTTVLSAVAALWLVLVLAVPESLWDWVLGEVWEEAKGPLLAVGVYHVAAAASLGPFLGLRSLRRTASGFRLRLGSGAGLVVAAAAGGWVGGAAGAGWALAGVEMMTLAGGAVLLRKAQPGHERPEFSESDEGGTRWA